MCLRGLSVIHCGAMDVSHACLHTMWPLSLRREYVCARAALLYSELCYVARADRGPFTGHGDTCSMTGQ